MDAVKVVLIVLGIGAALFAVSQLATAFVLLRVTLMRAKEQKGTGSGDRDIKTIRNEERDNTAAAFLARNPETMEMQSFDGLNLKAYYWSAPKPTRRFILLAHGYHVDGCGEWGAFLPFYIDRLGCNVLMPDQRCHGRSEGKYTAFSGLEWRDFLDWAQLLVDRFGADIQICLHGISMGAATVMLCNGHNPPPQVKCVIEDCGFSNGFEELYTASANLYHYRFRPTVYALNLWAKCLIHTDLKKDADPLGFIPQAKAPMLFIHGITDDLIPAAMCEALYAACGAEKEMLLLPDCEHDMAYYTDRPAYEAAVSKLLENHMPEMVSATI
ncbi:MAG: alpha/beta fold hydrolase [Oscillospiraceae bacterium]|jgi:alpha-beta hydrolase superfamily lysophospholipase|nr:alpha/beta fold hydrolase [Oscillospiraceae bacterium]